MVINELREKVMNMQSEIELKTTGDYRVEKERYAYRWKVTWQGCHVGTITRWYSKEQYSVSVAYSPTFHTAQAALDWLQGWYENHCFLCPKNRRKRA